LVSLGHQLEHIAHIGDTAEGHEPPVGLRRVGEVAQIAAGAERPDTDGLLKLAAAD